MFWLAFRCSYCLSLRYQKGYAKDYISIDLASFCKVKTQRWSIHLQNGTLFVDLRIGGLGTKVLDIRTYAYLVSGYLRYFLDEGCGRSCYIISTYRTYVDKRPCKFKPNHGFSFLEGSHGRQRWFRRLWFFRLGRLKE
jgi:hypothetical protein